MEDFDTNPTVPSVQTPSLLDLGEVRSRASAGGPRGSSAPPPSCFTPVHLVPHCVQDNAFKMFYPIKVPSVTAESLSAEEVHPVKPVAILGGGRKAARSPAHLPSHDGKAECRAVSGTSSVTLSPTSPPVKLYDEVSHGFAALRLRSDSDESDSAESPSERGADKLSPLHLKPVAVRRAPADVLADLFEPALKPTVATGAAPVATPRGFADVTNSPPSDLPSPFKAPKWRVPARSPADTACDLFERAPVMPARRGAGGPQ